MLEYIVPAIQNIIEVLLCGVMLIGVYHYWASGQLRKPLG